MRTLIPRRTTPSMLASDGGASQNLSTSATAGVGRAGTGLVVGFSLLLALMGLITVIGLGYMGAIKQQLHVVVEQRMAKHKLSSEMRLAARERTASLQRMMLLADPFERDEQWMNFNGQAGHFTRARLQMLELPLSDQEHQLLAEQGGFTGIAVPLQLQVVELIQRGRMKAAQHLLVEQAIPAQDRVLDVLRELQELQDHAAAAALIDSEGVYATARTWMIALSGSALVLGILIAAIVTYRNLSAHKALRDAGKQLQYRATHDSLTGLLNREEIDRRLELLLNDSRKSGAEHVICYLDIDMFKPINDTAGHAAGDELLRQMAEKLRSSLRANDLTGRVGGDEFIVVFVHCSLADGQRRAEELRHSVRDLRFAWSNQSFNVSISIGIAQIGPDSGTVTTVVSLVDDACRHAKVQGRNRTHIGGGSEIQQTHREDIVWANRIRAAVAEGNVVLHAQAVYPIGTPAAALHFEILVRLRDNEGKLALPGVFLPIAERYHLMPDLDRAVVRASLDALVGYRNAGGDAVLANINLSGQSLCDPEFLVFVTAAVRDSGIPPQWLCFEITETAAIANLSSALEFVGTLRAAGCRFALDDFGSGVSSFGYLKNLKVDYIKIDGVFVRDITDDAVDRAMVKAINEMAHVIGARTIAEYVESPAILEKLKEIHVDFAQGFGISVPQPLDAVLRTNPAARPVMWVRSAT